MVPAIAPDPGSMVECQRLIPSALLERVLEVMANTYPVGEEAAVFGVGTLSHAVIVAKVKIPATGRAALNGLFNALVNMVSSPIARVCSVESTVG
jgi:hypothetical protein